MITLRLSPSAAIAPDGDGYLLFDAATGQLVHLNPAAALVAELSDGTRTEEEIQAAVSPFLGDQGQATCQDWIHASLASGILKSHSSDSQEGLDPARADDDPVAFVQTARQLRDQGQVLAAFVCQWHVAHLDEENPSTWYGLGELAHIVGRRSVARDAYERYLALAPDDEEIAHLLTSLRDGAAPARASERCIAQIYERFASFYDESMCGDLGYQAPECLDAAVRATFGDRRDLDVLELGCGTGLAGRLLRAHAKRLIGLDLSAAMIARARTTGVYDGLELSEITAWLAGGDGATYDLIAACDTLIYFGDLRQVLVPAARRLRPHGVLAFTLEANEAFPFRLTDSGRYAHHPDHVRQIADETMLAITRLEAVTLRYEYGEPVSGLVVVLSKGTTGAPQNGITSKNTRSEKPMIRT